MTSRRPSGGTVCAADADAVVGLERLVREHAGEVFRLARAVGGSDAVAEDVTREVLLALLPGGEDDPEARRRRARRLAVEGAARRRPATPAAALQALLPKFAPDGHREGVEREGSAAWAARPLPDLLAAGGRTAVQRGLDALPAECRTVLALCDQAGLSAGDAADLLGRPVAAVTTLLHRGRLALREQVARHFAGGAGGA
jgi:RNA polymerase sigma-70 factor (ECF subfamily)